MTEIFKCTLCGISCEHAFSWEGNCLNCEENDEDKNFQDECDCMEDTCVCLYPSNNYEAAKLRGE